MRLILSLVLFVAAVAAKDYTGYKLIQVFPKTEENARILSRFEADFKDFDIWAQTKDLSVPYDVLLSPEAFVKYEAFFQEYRMPYYVLHENVQQHIDEEKQELSRLEGRVVGTYARHAAILAWMDSIAAANPSFVSQYSAGLSTQDRDLRVIKINTGNNPAKRIWIDCGIHAREWISPATCVNLIDKFVSEYNSGVAGTVNLLNKYEIHILPVLNPDGYEYTWVSDRFWRKNRRVNTGSTCVGVDLNRNFPFQWLTGGSSTDPCSDVHAGRSAGSEVETQAVMAQINKYDNWAAFYSIHSYGNWFLTSYGHTTALPPDYAIQKATGDIFASAVRALYGEIFTAGSTANLLYIASGASADWAYGSKRIVQSYVIELRPRNGFGLLGFDLPAAQIPLVGNEIYAGVKAIINFI